MLARHLHSYWNPTFESCGFVLKSGHVIEVENVSETPESNFEISEETLLRYESDVKATWHTHTGENANLSLEDYMTFLALPEFEHWIISKNRTICFFVQDSAVLIKGVFTNDNN